jgi:2',3'-cyclic-nucleotide 2'-phosphodiesterase (5'-nucleotidase family)
MQLSILHINDLHGRVERLAKLSTMVRRVRSQVEDAGGAVLFVDAGDAEEKSLLESDVTKGAAVIALLSAAGCQAMALGNGAPLSYGPQSVAGMAANASFPLLAANFTWTNGGETVQGATPAVLLDVGGVQVGLIGLAPTFDFWSLFGVDVPQGVEAVRSWRETLRARGATVIVVLSHQGTLPDRSLAKAVDGLDVIVGGHFHEELPTGISENGALIVQAGDYGRFLGRVDLTIDEDTGQVKRKRARLLPLDEGIEPDPAVMAEWERQKTLVAAMLQEPVGETLAPLPHDPRRESAMGNFLADVLRERMSTQAALCISGSLNEGLPGGVVTLGDMCRACSSPGNPARTNLTGAQLREFLELGLDRERAQQTPLFLRGRPLGILALSGLKVEVDPSAPSGQRVRTIWVDDQPLHDDTVYSVAASDFEMGGMTYQGVRERIPGVSFTIPPETVEYDLPIVLREALQEALHRHSPLMPPELGRIVHG